MSTAVVTAPTPALLGGEGGGQGLGGVKVHVAQQLPVRPGAQADVHNGLSPAQVCPVNDPGQTRRQR